MEARNHTSSHPTPSIMSSHTNHSQNFTKTTLSAVCNNQIDGQKVLVKNITCHSPADAMHCFHDPIFCENYFPRRRELADDDRPAYGEYSSLHHKNWIRIIQHGGIAFLYHPCLKKVEINKLRKLAASCLHRYVLAPYEKLSEKQPFGIISWGCFYISSLANVTDMKTFIREKADNGPASHVKTNGKFQTNLIEPSAVVTNERDQILCPTKKERQLFTVPPVTKKKKDPESIIQKRLETALHKRDKPDINISANITLTKVQAGNAVWAAGSLIFLCGILIGVLLYTKMWSHEEKQHKYNRLQDYSDGFEYGSGHSQFSLLKSSQKFMSVFKREDKHEPKLDSMSRMNLMIPIDEEDEEDETIFQR